VSGAPETTGGPVPAWRQPWLRELLRCPADRATLLDATGPDGAEVLRCTDPGHPVDYPVRDGVPVLLVDEAQPAPAAAEEA
jgi:uncharacterized protein YbaR (Trm112 family)